MTEYDIRQKIQQFGDIVSLHVVRDNRTNKHKGCCFVYYRTLQEAQKVIDALHNQVKLPPSEEYLQVRLADTVKQHEEWKLFVSHLPLLVNEEKLRELFSPFGAIEEIRIMPNNQGEGRGVGFVKFQSKDAAIEAINQMNGAFIGSDQSENAKPIQVKFANSQKNLTERQSRQSLIKPSSPPPSQRNPPPSEAHAPKPNKALLETPKRQSDGVDLKNIRPFVPRRSPPSHISTPPQSIPTYTSLAVPPLQAPQQFPQPSHPFTTPSFYPATVQYPPYGQPTFISHQPPTSYPPSLAPADNMVYLQIPASYLQQSIAVPIQPPPQHVSLTSVPLSVPIPLPAQQIAPTQPPHTDTSHSQSHRTPSAPRARRREIPQDDSSDSESDVFRTFSPTHSLTESDLEYVIPSIAGYPTQRERPNLSSLSNPAQRNNHLHVKPPLPSKTDLSHGIFVVGNGTLTALDLHKLFGEYGQVIQAVVFINALTEMPTKFCYVSFPKKTEAVNAQKGRDGTTYKGMVLKVILRRAREKRSRVTPPLQADNLSSHQSVIIAQDMFPVSFNERMAYSNDDRFEGRPGELDILNTAESEPLHSRKRRERSGRGPTRQMQRPSAREQEDSRSVSTMYRIEESFSDFQNELLPPANSISDLSDSSTFFSRSSFRVSNDSFTDFSESVDPTSESGWSAATDPARLRHRATSDSDFP
ncbi:putative RNA recognition motif domain [Blattamonas nauphoetae]|uniref:RNA recognition motif domain n=1 Tax=Blattamonas nauphoetae TaxID=2049346 RepID=A0ABQ9Y9R1_9EUKA|nr:putative RNA recognition motif domain [Blattamonas nauphoetae]